MTSSAANAVVDTDEALRRAIKAGVAELGARLDNDQIDRLTHYLRLLEKWNRVYNLSGVRDVHRMLAAHLLDSLSVRYFVEGPNVLDVGTGAGLPGIPLAITQPGTWFVLLDANAKKIRFIRQVVIELGLCNVTVQCERIEAYRPVAGFDTVISRAFASVMDFVAAAAPVCAPGGRMLAMKSSLTAEEHQWLRAMSEESKIYTLHAFKLNVPHIDSERQLMEIRKT